MVRAGLLLLSSLWFSGCMIVQTAVTNPVAGLSTVAVAPFFNLSQERSVNGRRFAIAYYAELQKIPGFQVVPVGVVEQAIVEHNLEMNHPADVVTLTKVLGVDAVVVGAITDYTPYYPPRVGLQVAWYAPGFKTFSPGVPTTPIEKPPLSERLRGRLPGIPMYGLPVYEGPAEPCEEDCEVRGQSPDQAVIFMGTQRKDPRSSIVPEILWPTQQAPANKNPGQSPPANSRATGPRATGQVQLLEIVPDSSSPPRLQRSQPRITQQPTRNTVELLQIDPVPEVWPGSSEQTMLPALTENPAPSETITPKLNADQVVEFLPLDVPTSNASRVLQAGGEESSAEESQVKQADAKEAAGSTEQKIQLTELLGGPILTGNSTELSEAPDMLLAQPERPPLVPTVPGMENEMSPPAKNPTTNNLEMQEKTPQMLPLDKPPTLLFPQVPPQVPSQKKKPAHLLPLMSYTRIFDGADAEYVANLRDYLELRGDLRSGGYEGYLHRSEDFIRFSCHRMIVEMLTLHGGQSRTRIVFKSRKVK